METFLVSTGVVALAEIGDKTQLLALLLAARFRAPLAITAGILVATVANHAAAGLLGAFAVTLFEPDTVRYLLAASFIAIGAWVLVPDRLDAKVDPASRYGAFATTVVLFFLAEIGDKTQVATVVLAARHAALVAVVLGTTLGMLIANAPVVWAGDRFASRIPVRLVHVVAAVLFILMGIATLFPGLTGPLA